MKGIAILSTLLLFTLTSATAAQKAKAAPILATGTGFFITEDGYLLTNNHVIDGAAVITVKIDGKELPAKIIKVDKQNDLAVLKVEGKFSALPVISSRKVGLGDEVFTIGFPQVGVQGFLPKLTKGSISSLAGIRGDARNFQISVPIQPGNSGGPLVDEYGNVVGVVVARLNAMKLLKERGALPQNVNYAVKGSFASAFLEALPNMARKLLDGHLRSKTRKFSEVAQEVQAATVLILINEMAAGGTHIAGADKKDTLPKDIPSLKALAEKGDAVAQNMLGERYFHGNGVEKSIGEATKWIRKAALQGNYWGQYNLGVLYRDGSGVLEDAKEAARWFRKAGEQGFARAQTELGISALWGRGVPPDNKEAAKWFRKAAEQKNALGAYFLARMYYNGMGVLEDNKEAYKWYRVSAEQGDEDAQAQVGFMLCQGQGVRKDNREGVKWLRRAADREQILAQYNLALAYDEGEGVLEDDREAAKWYDRAASQGHDGAQLNLGVMYAFGEGVEKNLGVAYMFYNFAAANGNARAKKNKGIIVEDMTAGQIDQAQELCRTMLKKYPKLLNNR